MYGTSGFHVGLQLCLKLSSTKVPSSRHVVTHSNPNQRGYPYYKRESSYYSEEFFSADKNTFCIFWFSDLCREEKNIAAITDLRSKVFTRRPEYRASLPRLLKMAISEFGLSMLMLILLNHFMFIEIIRYLHDSKWFGSQ